MVLHHLQKLLEFGKTCCQFAWASVGSTFALLASFWHSTCGPSTKHLGFKTWCVLPICESWILERCGIGQQPTELTSWFVCRFLPHVNSSCVHIFTFCACALKRARLWRTGLTWPDLTWPKLPQTVQLKVCRIEWGPPWDGAKVVYVGPIFASHPFAIIARRLKVW